MNDKAVIFSLTRRLNCDYVTTKGTKRHGYIPHSLKFKFQATLYRKFKVMEFSGSRDFFSGFLKPGWCLTV